MKIVLFDRLYDTKKLVLTDIQKFGQYRLDQWLGKAKVKFEIAQKNLKVFTVTLWREYGPWYEDPRPWSDHNEYIVDVDVAIFLAAGYQTGTVADFSEHLGWCIWRPDVETMFLPEMKEMAKRHHGSRIKHIAVDNYLDHVELTITYV